MVIEADILAEHVATPNVKTAFLSIPCNQLWLFDEALPPKWDLHKL